MLEVIVSLPSNRWWPSQVIAALVTYFNALTFLIMGAIGYMVNTVFGAMFTNGNESSTVGLMYPRESETREVKNLDGMWNFVRSDSNNPSQGLREKWFSDDLSKFKPTVGMPVPSSYNDVTEDAALRDHVGTVWYDRKFFVPKSWGTEDQRVFVRFGSVHYDAIVWINGVQVAKHEIGHLPFEVDISTELKYGAENRITVLCDNVLLQVTVPQGKVQNQPVDGGVELVQTYTFDFFNYAGIHRSVMLYTVPRVFIRDVAVSTDLVDEEGHIYYNIRSNLNGTNDLQATVKIIDKNGTVVGVDSTAGAELKGVVVVKDVKPWWPYLMHEEPGYMYSMEVTLQGKSNEASEPVGEIYDVYRMKVGVRTLEWNNTSLLINGRPIYFRGFGRHEDSDIRGKGLDYALLTKDFNLLKWVGANAYRTSHYPYSEESMQFADEHGIMIIDECPSVDTENYSQILLGKHKSSIEQLIHRDRNHPSVVMWSIANEPRTGLFAADAYFEAVAKYTRLLDPSRPVTAAIAVGVNDDRAAQHLDIISFNRYNGWYSNAGKLNMITNRVVEEAKSWNAKHNKPVLMSEYGADTMEGLHMLPAYIWSEDYQSQVFSRHFRAFDDLRKQHFFIGEFVWNFADFKTAQTYTRVGGNKKGIFTRNRQPKAAAYLLRQRYHALGEELDKSTLPDDLFLYTAGSSETSVANKSEL
ncbi:beta-glucuronidase isoform X2 [Ochlerotatus camptorhynchus]|uniref:beta-glucuronidase isoform X2 n=1 Tax=Ochlerotatus camptorhynchus TaxID=644619 RepID=UPI0031D6B36F